MGTAPDDLRYERTARRDLRYWALLAIGLVFLWAGLTVDPQKNCSEDGECAPWLVPVAAVIGLGATAMGLGVLLANPRRGSFVDSANSELVWWQGGQGGRIPLERIARIRIVTDSDSDAISLYDMTGERLPYFDGEVVPWPFPAWAERLRQIAPHVHIEIVE